MWPKSLTSLLALTSPQLYQSDTNRAQTEMDAAMDRLRNEDAGTLDWLFPRCIAEESGLLMYGATFFAIFGILWTTDKSVLMKKKLHWRSFKKKFKCTMDSMKKNGRNVSSSKVKQKNKNKQKQTKRKSWAPHADWLQHGFMPASC